MHRLFGSAILKTMETHQRFLKPEVLAKLAGLDVKARLVVEGFLAGLHKSPYHGFSVEFAEYRQYIPGDELKRVDWKVYARSDRYYVKEFEEETNLRAWILLDASSSMGYKSDGLPKLEYACYLAASLAYLLLKQQDAVGLVLFDQAIRTYIPPRATTTHLTTILQHLDRAKPGGKTDVSATFHELAEKIKRRGLIIVLSDLMDEPDKVLQGLKHFRHRKHEVLAFHILDPAELELPLGSDAVFKDMETGEELPTSPGDIRESYQRLVKGWTEHYRKECRDHLIDYVSLSTSTPFDKALLAYLSKRQRVR